MSSPGQSEEQRDLPSPVPRPAVAPAADLARVRVAPIWLASCFGAAFLIYLAFLPRFLRYCSPPSGDQPFYLMDTVSLVQDHDLNVKNNYDNHDEEKFFSLAPHPRGFVGMSVPNPLGRQLTASVARPSSEQYSVHPPGLPILLAPVWAIGGAFRLWWPATLVAMCAIGALTALNAFLLAHALTGRWGIALAVWAGIAFSNPLMTYSYLIFTELPAGLLMVYAFRRLALGWRANGPLRLLLIGACIGYIPWLAWRCALIAVPLGVYAAWQWWRAWRGARAAGPAANNSPESARASLLSAGWLVAPVAASVALVAAYSVFRFGRLLPSSGQPGVDVVFHWPWAGRVGLVNFVTNSFGLLFDVQFGLLVYAPIYLLAAVGFVVLLRAAPADRRLVGWMAACSLPYTFVIMAFLNWNGIWCPPARYQTTLVPLLAAPLAMSLYACRSWLYRLLFCLLSLWGLAMMAILLHYPIFMWPWSDARLPWNGLFSGGVFFWLARSPEIPFHVDLRHVLPSFLTPDDANQPVTTGRAIGLAFAAVLLSALPVLRRAAAPTVRSASVFLRGIGWFAATVVLGSGWYLINVPYLRSRTSLVELQRWKLPNPLIEAHGMAFLDGRLYIASLGPRSAIGILQPGAGELGTFDPASGVYTRVQLTSAQGVLPYSYPGDVKVGPDHLLYFLNNGPETQALYVMRPDGYVVRQMALGNKGAIALGFSLAPDGKLYATDMGHVHQYGPQGGQELRAWGGPKGIFNNIAGITVGPDGTVYVAETGERRIHEFDGGGRFLRTVTMDTQPWQMVTSGDWLDIACDQGIRSLNRRTNNLHVSTLTPADPPLHGVTALAYGPDNRLYVLTDGITIVAYAVKR